MALLNYNRSLLTNQAATTSIPLTGLETLVLEFGLFVSQPVNFVELLTTVGWGVINPVGSLQPTIRLVVLQDGIAVASAHQESVVDGEDANLEMVTSFQAVLTNVPVGHHVYRLLASNLQPAQGDIIISGPTNISGKVIS